METTTNILGNAHKKRRALLSNKNKLQYETILHNTDTYTPYTHTHP